MGSLLGIINGALGLINKIMDFITMEKLKQAGINEQVIVQMEKHEKVRKAADDARKNPPTGNIIDHL